MSKKSNMIWGAVFIVLGIVIALAQLNILKFNFEGWWTLIIIIPALLSMSRDGINAGNSIWCVIGVMLLLSAQNIISWDIMWKLVIPAIFVIIGIGMIMSNHNIDKMKDLNQKDMTEYGAVFSGQEIKVTDEFKGANIDAIFGEADLDLKDAVINQDIVIKASSIFGKVKLIIPDYVNIQISNVPIFGGVSNKHKKQTEVDPNQVTYKIYISSICMFGGIEIL